MTVVARHRTLVPAAAALAGLLVCAAPAAAQLPQAAPLPQAAAPDSPALPDGAPPDGAPLPTPPPLIAPWVAPPPPLPPREPGEQNAATRPLLSLGNDLYYVKPILAMAGGLSAEIILQSPNQTADKQINQEHRVTTVAITRFGFEGRLGRYVSFRSEFERNIGAHGSGVWEGTASFSVRDQFIRLERWGVQVDGGIITDLASVDFFSMHTADLLMADKYTRNPLLYSGFNRGQGLKVSYGIFGLRAGLSFTAANPLSTSTSYQVGGAFAGGSRLWEKPLGNFRIGQPDDDFEFRVLSPSLTYEHKFVEVKTMAQVFWIDYQTSSKQNPLLFGYNLRGSVMGKIPVPIPRLPLLLTPFANVAWVTNDALQGEANKVLETRYQALTYSAGMDIFAWGRSGLGFNVVQVRDQTPSYVPATGMTPAMEPITHTTQTFVNVGLSYWFTEYVALGVRGAMYHKEQDGQPDVQDLSIYTTLRLVI